MTKTNNIAPIFVLPTTKIRLQMCYYLIALHIFKDFF